VLADLIRSISRPGDPHVAIARQMARDAAGAGRDGTAVILRKRRAQEATTVIITKTN
jgi:hypothetical protein